VSTAGGAADPLPPLEITREPFESMVAQALVDALMVDLDERYAADGAGDGDNPTAGYHRIPSYGQYEGDELSVCFAKDVVRLVRRLPQSLE